MAMVILVDLTIHKYVRIMKVLSICIACFLCVTWTSCTKDSLIGTSQNNTLEVRDNDCHKVTGDVEIIWNGGGGMMQGEDADANGEKHAFVDLVAFEPSGDKSAKGDFQLDIYQGQVLHREISAEVVDAVIHPDEAKAWFLAEVIFDSKACGEHGGGGPGSHEEGDEGCDHGDETDGGCTHEEGDEGCDHGDETDGGCTDEEGHDGGCPGSDAGQGNHVSGRQCRVGQIIAVKVHDADTPGMDGDGITWKWFRANAPHLPDIGDTGNWPHLCKKTIVAGNLVVH